MTMVITINIVCVGEEGNDQADEYEADITAFASYLVVSGCNHPPSNMLINTSY